MLEKFELEAQTRRSEPEIAGTSLEDRRAADARSNEPRGGRDLFPVDQSLADSGAASRVTCEP